MKTNENKQQSIRSGISLIVLVITIIVIIILAAAVILSLNNNNPITNAKKASFQSDLKQLQESFNMYASKKQVDTLGEFNISSLYANETSVTYNTKTSSEETNIYSILPTIDSKYRGKIEIWAGKFVFSSADLNELLWAKDIGIDINEFTIEDGVLKSTNSSAILISSNGILEIPNGVWKIDAGAFYNTPSIKKVIMPSSLREIGSGVFKNNTNIEEVILNDGLETIGDSAFWGCTKLKNILIPDSVTNIGGNAFRECYSFTKIKLPSKLKTISSCLFYHCINLESIEIPDGLVDIQGLAFAGCSKLGELTLSQNVNSIVSSAFLNCASINLKIDSNNKTFTVSDNIIYSNGGATLVLALPNSITSSVYTIPNNVTSIVGGAFCMIPCIREVVMPATYTTGNLVGIVGSEGQGIPGINKITVDSGNPVYSSINGSLYDKSGKRLISFLSTGTIAVIPEGVEELSSRSFAKFNKMTDIILPNSLITIHDNTFYSCSNFKRIEIGKNVTTIAIGAFYYCGISNIIISDENPKYVSENGFVMDKTKKNLITYAGTSDNVEIPNTIENIHNKAFGMKAMKAIKIPSSVKTIGSNVFRSCNSLTTVDIPNSVVSIGLDSFAECSQLTKINIDNTKGKISGSAWGNPYGEKAIYWLR